jgi:hypothetical protein
VGVYIYVTKPSATMECNLKGSGERVKVSLYRYAYKPYTWPEDNVKLNRKYVHPCEMAFAKKGTEPEKYGLMVGDDFRPGDDLKDVGMVFETQGHISVYDDNVGFKRCGDSVAKYCPYVDYPTYYVEAEAATDVC